MIESIVVGVFGSLVASFTFLFFLTRLKPNLKISKSIAVRRDSENNPVSFAIKVMNDGSRNAIELRAELFSIRLKNIPGEHPLRVTHKIALKRSEKFIINKYSKDNTETEYAFRFTTSENLDALWKDEDIEFLMFVIYARDELSNFGKVFKQEFKTKRNTFKDGEFHSGKSFEIS